MPGVLTCIFHTEFCSVAPEILERVIRAAYLKCSQRYLVIVSILGVSFNFQSNTFFKSFLHESAGINQLGTFCCAGLNLNCLVLKSGLYIYVIFRCIHARLVVMFMFAQCLVVASSSCLVQQQQSSFIPNKGR